MENTYSQWNVSESCTSALCISQVSIVCFIAVVSLAGNLGILVTLLSTPSLRNSHGYLLTSLAVADFGVGLVAASAVYPSVTHVWPYGNAACKITAYFEAVFTLASSLSLIMLSIERYIAVAHPFKYVHLVTKRNTVISTITVCWALPVTFYAGFILVQSHYQFTQDAWVCTPAYGDRFFYTLAGLLVFFFPSLLIIGITSVIVHRTLSQNAQHRESMLAMVMSPSSSPSSPPSSPPSSESDSLQPRLSRREVKMFRLVRAVALAFYICWVPNVAVGLGYLAAGQRSPSNLVFFLYWLHLSSGLCNFVIYFVMNTNFRKAITEKVGVCCHLCCKKRRQSYTVENRERQ
ncbi:RYamide receptor-like [Patiria miniata]|uniref:G-protein coupled receptors family 1 profile domain-containing protein n=1 Tax=Patiria miniata TaxID=46514 RepID=A0A914BDL7_PATMI|nr:RYamide receptor-like [Patiria miniata]